MAIKNMGYENYFYGKDEQYGVNNLDDEDDFDWKNLEDILNSTERLFRETQLRNEMPLGLS